MDTTATRYRCNSGLDSVHCSRGNGKPTRKSCAHCGGQFWVQQGKWGVFAWTGTGRYPEERAVRTFVRESAAEQYATKINPEYVVRWIVA